jgi:hypothetical protein
MSYSAQLAVEPDNAERSARRRLVDLSAYVRNTGANLLNGRALDLSADGCRIMGVALEPGTRVWLKISGLTPRAARVAWVKDEAAGCEFEVPIAEGLVEELLKINAETAVAGLKKTRERLRRQTF